MHSDAAKHRTSTEADDVLPGASAEYHALAQPLVSQLRHATAKHMAVERSGSNIPMLEEAADAAAGAEQADSHPSSDVLAPPGNLNTEYRPNAEQPQPASVIATPQVKSRAGIAALHVPRLAHSADAAHAQLHQIAGQAAGPAKHHLPQHSLQQFQQQPGQQALPPAAALDKQPPNLEQHHGGSGVLPAQEHQRVSQPVGPELQGEGLRHRQRAGLHKGHGKGIRGILPLAQPPDRRLAPETALQGISNPGGQSSSIVVSRGAKKSADESFLPIRAPSIGNIGAGGCSVLRRQSTLKPARSIKHRKPKRMSMHAALQQSAKQVKACASQLEEQSVQQQAMQKALQGMTTSCEILHDNMFRMLQQLNGT